MASLPYQSVFRYPIFCNIYFLNLKLLKSIFLVIDLGNALGKPINILNSRMTILGNNVGYSQVKKSTFSPE